jgi:hypothetical protein
VAYSVHVGEKLLSYRATIAKNNFVTMMCGSKLHATLAGVPQKRFWGEDPLVQGAVRGYNKKN